MFVATYGNSKAFEPIWFSSYPIYNYPSSIFTSSYTIPYLYDIIPLKKTLSKFIDFDKINNISDKDVTRRRTARLIVTSTNIQRSESVTFDSEHMKIDADHIIACAGFPFYGIAWTHKDGKYLWDRSLLSNTPLREVIDASPKYDKRVYIVNVFPRYQEEAQMQ
jgi:NTE family protein